MPFVRTIHSEFVGKRYAVSQGLPARMASELEMVELVSGAGAEATPPLSGFDFKVPPGFR
jgi:hypothetical protein